MTVALRNPDLVSALIPVDNSPINAPLRSDFAKYVRGMKAIEEAKVSKQSEADKILQEYEPVKTKSLSPSPQKEKKYQTNKKNNPVPPRPPIPPHQPDAPPGPRVEARLPRPSLDAGRLARRHGRLPVPRGDGRRAVRRPDALHPRYAEPLRPRRVGARDQEVLPAGKDRGRRGGTLAHFGESGGV